MDPIIGAGATATAHQPDPGGRRRRPLSSRRHKALAGLTVLGLAAGAAGIAAALSGAPGELPNVGTPPPATQFDLTGFIQSATVARQGTNPTDPGAAHYGGTLVVNGQTVVIPDETVVILPANALTWAELFSDAPAPYGPTQTGMAMNDSPKPLTTYEVNVIGNRVGDKYIAGLVHIAQNDLNSGAGYINFIDYDVSGRAELRIGGTLHDPNCTQGSSANPHTVAGGPSCTGTRVQINDPAADPLNPDGRFGRAQSDDPRFTVDPENPTIASATGYPMCIPRTLTDPVAAFVAGNQSYALTPIVPAPTDITVSLYTVPAYDDPKCPLTNRLEHVDANLNSFGATSMLDATQPGGFATSTNSGAGGAQIAGYVKDATVQIPMEIGDYVNFAGTLINDAAGAAYVSAHTIINNFAAYTRPGVNPAYASVEVALVGTGGLTVFGAGEAAIRTKFEGMSTDATRKVHVYGIDINPFTGALSDRDWGAVMPDPGPVGGVGAVQGRWRLRPPCTAAAGAETDRKCSPPPGGGYLPPTRELRAVIENPDGTIPVTNNASPTSANGIIFGQYHAPIGEYIFPENIPGTPIVPNNFESLDFLAYGGYVSADGTQAGQLDPWPGAAAPAKPTCLVTSVPGTYAGNAGTSVQLNGVISAGSTPIVLSWSATPNQGQANGTFTSATTVNPVFNIPAGVPAGNTYTVTMTATNLCGTVTATNTVAVLASPPQVATTTATLSANVSTVVTLKASSTSPDAGVTFSFSQTGGTAIVSPQPVVVTGVPGAWAATFSFTAPATATVDTFTIKAISPINGPSNPGVTATVTVNAPLAATITLTGAEYRTGKQRLVLTATYPGNPADVMKLMPYVTTTGTTFDPVTLGSTFSLANGIYTLTLVGAPPPACGNPGGYQTPCSIAPLLVNTYSSVAPATQTGTSGFQALQRIRQ